MAIKDYEKNIENEIEAKETEVNKYENNIEIINQKLQVVEKTISNLSEDKNIQEVIERNQNQLEVEKLSEEQYAKILLDELFNILQDLMEIVDITKSSKEDIETLKNIGEDVSSAEEILQDREKIISQTKEKIDDLVKRLGGKVKGEVIKYDIFSQKCGGVIAKNYNSISNYEKIIQQRYENSDINVRNVFDNFKDKLIIQNASMENGEAFFNPNKNYLNGIGVYYNTEVDLNNLRGNGTTYYHEIGHMIDHLANNSSSKKGISDNIDFLNALYSDSKNVEYMFNQLDNENRAKAQNKMLDSNICHSLSDILEATTNGRLKGKYGHMGKNKYYWDTTSNITSEAFAHFFEASMNDDDTKIKRLNYYFPNSYNEFLNIIQNIHNNYIVL